MGLETSIGEKGRTSHTQVSLIAYDWAMFLEEASVRSTAFSRQTNFLMNSLSELDFLFKVYLNHNQKLLYIKLYT